MKFVTINFKYHFVYICASNTFERHIHFKNIQIQQNFNLIFEKNNDHLKIVFDVYFSNIL